MLTDQEIEIFVLLSLIGLASTFLVYESTFKSQIIKRQIFGIMMWNLPTLVIINHYLRTL